VRHLRDMRVEFLAKLYFLRRTEGGEVMSLIDRQIEFLVRLRTRVSQSGHPQTDDPVLSGFASRFRYHQMSAAIEWLDECRQGLIGEQGDGKDDT